MKDEELIEKITEMHTNIVWIKRELDGNGKPGLIQRVASNSKWISMVTGALILLSALFSYGMIQII